MQFVNRNIATIAASYYLKMRKLFVPIIALIAVTTIVSTTTSCDNTTDENSGSVSLDTSVVHNTQADSVKTVEGVVIDGARSSVDIVTEKKDTLHFEYEGLPEDKIYRSEEGENIEVTYYPENDSVIEIRKKEQ